MYQCVQDGRKISKLKFKTRERQENKKEELHSNSNRGNPLVLWLRVLSLRYKIGLQSNQVAL